jgi:predicted transcriptional regulator of viral defense system
MNTIDFQKKLQPYQVFSLQDIKKFFPDFSYRQIDRWEKKGYLLKIKQGFYTLTDQDINQNFSFLVANRIYHPSYISLEKALKYHRLIPEEVFQITSVSTKKTAEFDTPVGNFGYRHISPKLFWGYKLVKTDTSKFLIADAEKAILDYLYLNSRLKTAGDFEGMRINTDSFVEHIDNKKFQKYLDAFNNKALTKRANTFLITIQND